MICPNEMCNKEIPDDSIFCDQCPNCHSILHTPFCSKCGTPTVERKWGGDSPETGNSNADKSSLNNTSVIEETSQTLIIAKTPTLKLQHDDLILDITSGDVLGRTTGAHTGKLADFKVISSRHAEISLNDNKWFITDLGSTNGSLLNTKKLVINTEYEINDGDELVLADIHFTAHIS